MEQYKGFRQLIDGVLQPRDKHSQRRYEDYISEAKDGCYEETLTKARKAKSDKQVRMIFGLMIQSTIDQADELGLDTSGFLKYLLSEIPNGVGLNKDFLHALMYQVCPTFNDNGQRVTLSKMNTKQAADLFERFRNIVATSGIVIDDPVKDWNKTD